MYLYMKGIEKCLVSLENLVSLYLQGLYIMNVVLHKMYYGLPFVLEYRSSKFGVDLFLGQLWQRLSQLLYLQKMWGDTLFL